MNSRAHLILFHAMVVGCMVLTAPVAGRAQVPLPDGVTIEELENIADFESLPTSIQNTFSTYLDSREACLTAYQLGSIVFLFDSTSSNRLFQAGQSFTASGTIRNINPYPIPQGKVLVRILRDDPTVAAEHWHPIVAEFTLPEQFDLSSEGTAPFTFSWPIPPGAPSGTYRAEVHFLAGGRYSMGGLAFVPNFTAGSIVFGVQEGSAPAAVTFDRSSVQLQGEPLALRAVPPTLQPDIPLVVEVALTAEGTAEPVAATITTELHEWSDTDAEPPIEQTTQEASLVPGQVFPVAFAWDRTQSGVYELVIKAQPHNSSVLPSIVRVRFPIEGNTPRVVFSGVTSIEEEEALVTTCVVNGTHGTGAGSVTTEVASEGRNLVTATGNLDAEVLSTIQTRLNLDEIGSSLAITTTATNDQGHVTDAHTVTYDAADIVPPTDEVDEVGRARLAILVLILVLLILLVSAIVIVWRRRPPVTSPPPSL